MSLRIVLLLALGLVLGCARPQGRPPTSAAVPDTQALRQLTVPQPQTAVETLQTLLETQGARVQRPDDRSIPILSARFPDGRIITTGIRENLTTGVGELFLGCTTPQGGANAWCDELATALPHTGAITRVPVTPGPGEAR
jgi:hypothetical protein